MLHICITNGDKEYKSLDLAQIYMASFYDWLSPYARTLRGSIAFSFHSLVFMKNSSSKHSEHKSRQIKMTKNNTQIKIKKFKRGSGAKCFFFFSLGFLVQNYFYSFQNMYY